MDAPDTDLAGIQLAGYLSILRAVPGSLNIKGGKRWNLGSIFCHSALFGFVSQRWNPLLRKEKSRKKLQSEKSGPISYFLAPPPPSQCQTVSRSIKQIYFEFLPLSIYNERSSVVDPKLFFSDPDSDPICPSFGSGSCLTNKKLRI
jgi:hypothetical protein